MEAILKKPRLNLKMILSHHPQCMDPIRHHPIPEFNAHPFPLLKTLQKKLNVFAQRTPRKHKIRPRLSRAS